MYHGHDIYISIICSPKFQISRQTKTCLIYQLNLPKVMPPFQVYLQSEHALFQSKPSNFIIHISIDCISSSLLKLFKHLGWLKNKSQSIRKRQFMAKEQNPARNDDCWGIKLSPHVFSKLTRGPRLKNRSPLSSRFTVEKKISLPAPSSLLARRRWRSPPRGHGGGGHGASAAPSPSPPPPGRLLNNISYHSTNWICTYIIFSRKCSLLSTCSATSAYKDAAHKIAQTIWWNVVYYNNWTWAGLQ